MSAFAILLHLLIGGQLVDCLSTPGEEPVRQKKIRTLIEHFSAGDEPTRFCLGHYRAAEYAVAIYDKKKKVVRVFIGGEKRGRTYSVKVDGKDPPGLHLEDFDGDGRAELFVCTSVVEGFRLTEDGLQNFWTSDGDLVSRPPPRVVLADLNLDGRRDVIVSNYKHVEPIRDSQCLYVYLQTDGGDAPLRRSAALTFTDELGNHCAYGIAVGNFYGDDTPEIVVGNHTDGQLWQVEFTNGALTVRHTWKAPSGGAIWDGLAAGDLTGDSLDELLIGTEGGDIFVYSLSREKPSKLLASKHAGKFASFVEATNFGGEEKDEFVLVRGFLGSNGLTEDDVVLEIYRMDHGVGDRFELHRVLQKKAEGFRRPHLMLHDLDRDGVDNIILYNVGGEPRRIQILKPKLE